MHKYGSIIADLFVLDTDIRAKDTKSLVNLGAWLLNKWSAASERLKQAKMILKEIGIEHTMLRSQWKLQKKQQRLLHPRQSKLHGVRMVQKILELRVGQHRNQSRRDAVRAKLLKSTQTPITILNFCYPLTCSRLEVKMADRNLGRHEAMLGRVGGIAFDTLKKMKANRFFEMRMNVCALKRRLRDKLQERRFEEGRLRADYRPFVTDYSGTERRGGVFKRLANKINALINDMTVLKKSRTAPGLGHGQDEDMAPAWLCDEETRRGIVAMLEKARCKEEKCRLTWEVTAAVKWFGEEEEEIQLALLHAENPVTSYHVARRLDLHLNMGGIWHAHLDAIGFQLDWPPSLVHATMHNQAVLYSRQVRQTLSSQVTDNTPLNMKDFQWHLLKNGTPLMILTLKMMSWKHPFLIHLVKRM
ncbi:hypothetical protein BS47DRAFT_1357670 [Hydnum rufescens UP504]|uniref:Uncharacterized protein n=1 Tax=Hydnum rufescens UP504 TaxID=1448309 RepID=A0A9P6B9P0_9AGAM|nr:hypothetical protein BS47DRAFT_1357670 [Hydnum rufescens UP504]